MMAEPTPAEIASVRKAAADLLKVIDGPNKLKLLAALVENGRIGPGRLAITLELQALAKWLKLPMDRIDPASLTLKGNFTLRRREVEAKLVLDEAAPEVDHTLLKNLSLGWSWFAEIRHGASMDEIASRSGVSQRAIARLIDLAFLAPDVVETIIAGRQPVNLTANVLIKAQHQRLWHSQRAMITAL